MRMHIAMSVIAVAVLGAVPLHAADAISLDGEWSLRYWPQFSAEEAVRDVASVPADAKSVKATVPGNCELDLVNAGLMPPPELDWGQTPGAGFEMAMIPMLLVR